MMPGIVLGEDVRVGILSENSKKRLDLGIKLLKKGSINCLILSGGVRKRPGYKKFIGKNYSLAEIMKNYALKKNVESNKIILEDLSEETVGQLIFLKQGILDPRNINEAKIITSQYHKFRVKKEIEAIFGKRYKFSYSVTENNISQEIESAQLRSLNLFFKTFKDVNFSKDYEVLKVLLNKHPIYNHDSKFYLKELNKMITFNQK